MELNRRSALGFLAATGLTWFAEPGAPDAQPSAKFGYENVRTLAAELASNPQVLPSPDLPRKLLDLSYDQYRDIRFRPARTIPLGASSFHVQTFHPGFLFRRAVKLNIVGPDGVTAVDYSADMFDFGKNVLNELPGDVGFAGFKVIFPLNEPRKLDEVISFLGASFFRFLGRGQRYGLSARGLAIGSGDVTQKEEFPFFREFWIVTPAPESPSLRVLALLDSASVTGAYEFIVTPAEQTEIEIKATLFARADLTRMGLAPLTSMFFIGSADRGANDDFRPNVHDSDTLLVHPDERRWIARPLNNPSAISVLHFESENPKGFGLLQRERLFSNYQDLEAEYHLRPAYWVKPLSDWGKGSVSLVELPTRSEAEDNIVAFWNPSRVLAAGDSAEWRYRLTAMAEEARLHDLGRVAATRYSLAKASDAMVQRSFVIDFDRDDLGFVSLDLSPVEIVVDVLGGAVERTSLSRHKSRDGIRAKFDVRAPPGANPQISVYLRRGSRILTETWVYNFADGR